MLGGGLAGLQAAAIKMQLGEAANGVVNVDLWEPVPTMQFPGVMDFIKKYQAKAPAEGIDLLGYFLPPFAYSELQILGDAIAASKALDNEKLAEYMHSHPFHTIEGDIAFGPMASGPRRGRSGRSTTTSRGTMSSSSASRRPSRSSRRRATRPAT
jgi:branched-chain amino acid transport system substrate-binding protein